MVDTRLLRSCAVAVGLLCGCSAAPEETEETDTTSQAVTLGANGTLPNPYQGNGSPYPWMNNCRYVDFNADANTSTIKKEGTFCIQPNTTGYNVQLTCATYGTQSACTANTNCTWHAQAWKMDGVAASNKCRAKKNVRCAGQGFDECSADTECVLRFSSTGAYNGCVPITQCSTAQNHWACLNVIDKGWGCAWNGSSCYRPGSTSLAPTLQAGGCYWVNPWTYRCS